MQNKKELIRLRRFMPAARLPEPGARKFPRNFACGANYLDLAPQGGSNFACGAKYPHQALKGGYFVFVWRVGT
jgi:hypothetical protein